MGDMVILPTFWSGKRVLVTGHTGFKGSWLSLWLNQMGAETTGYALCPPTQPSLFEIATVGDTLTSVIADVSDLPRLMEVIGDFRPEIVFHLAAQPLVRQSYLNPLETYQTNVMGTANLLEAVRSCDDTRVVVNVTSDKCYQNNEWPWSYREIDALGGHDPYSSSKACSEIVCAAFRSSYFGGGEGRHKAAIATARAGNVIGGGDWASDRLIPDILQAQTGGETLDLRYPQAVRPWQHVLEPLRGYLTMAQALWSDGPAYSEAWNFGPDECDFKEVAWIVDWFARAFDNDRLWRHEPAPEFHEAGLLKLDYAKSYHRLGWRPVWRIDTALKSILEWHRAFDNGDDMAALTIAQIARYEAALAAGESTKNSDAR